MPFHPAFRIPRRSGPHRIAALALYRALLSQCRRLQIEQAPRDELQDLIRNRFKQARRDQSISKLKITFEAGYEAIDLLDAAVTGNENSKGRILKLLSDAPWKARQPPPPPRGVGKPLSLPIETAQDTASPDKPHISLFDRPLPLSQLSGKRHVPVLVNANHIPMLRIKKPIPAHLSGYLAHRIKTRQKRHTRRERLEEEIKLAEMEDEWDDIVERQESGGGRGRRTVGRVVETGWTDEIYSEIGVVHRQLGAERRKNAEMAAKMQEVVDWGRELFERERAEEKAMRAKQKAEDVAEGQSDATRPKDAFDA